MRTRIAIAIAASVLTALLGASPAAATFGFSALDVVFERADGSPDIAAGSHPYAMATTIDVNSHVDLASGIELPDGEVKELIIRLPEGLTGDPAATQVCSNAEFIDRHEGRPSCVNSSVIGYALLKIGRGGPGFVTVALYNLTPPPGVAAKFGFIALNLPVTIEIGVAETIPYNLRVRIPDIVQAASFYGSKTVVWGNPVDETHDPYRGSCLGGAAGGLSGPELISEGICHVTIAERPLLTLPRACKGPLLTSFEATSWADSSTWVPGEVVSPKPRGFTDCGKLGFALDTSALPSTRSAESAAGLDFKIDVDDQGLTNSQGTANADIEAISLALPEGMTVNPSAAEGLGVCTKAQFDAEHLAKGPGQGCPDAAKLGSLEAESPALENHILHGSLYLAQQDDPATTTSGAENPFDTLIALYMVIRDPERGVFVKLAGRVEPDPRTGQLITTVADLPPFPLSHVNVRMRSGPRAPLTTPAACGRYRTVANLTPSSGAPPLESTSTFTIDSGVAGGPCPPAGPAPFHPGFEAGSINNSAGVHSPFYMRLTRGDGEQDLTRFSAILPRGVTGKIAGVGRCSDAAIQAARAKSGRAELAEPSCPQSARVGRVLGGAGVGEVLTYVPGQLYLAGPYAGDPLSVVAIVPAVAGPFDAGTVVTRVALTLNPETAEVEVDGARSDPIPHILKGIPLRVRDLRVFADRPDFTLNPTSCAPTAAKATVFGGFLDVFNPADDVPVSLQARYQAASCASLAFKPKLSFKLRGGSKRGDHPALTTTVKYPPGGGYANIGKAVVSLPHSAFLDQAHIRTVCTRVQFKAHQCPPGSIYGYAKATTPLLDETVEGPVYLRSSNHPLPDLVFALRGIVEVDVVARIDSTDGRIRATLDSVPDVPVSKFTLEMKGGKKGLIVNSRDLCAHKSRAIAELTGQNGRRYETQPVLATDCVKSDRKRHRLGL